MLRYILLVEVHNKKKWEPAALEGLWCDFCPGLALSVIVPPRAGHTAGSRQLASPNFWKNLILRSAFWDPPPHIYNALAEGRSRFSGEGSSLFKLERNLFLFSLLLLKQN